MHKTVLWGVLANTCLLYQIHILLDCLVASIQSTVGCSLHTLYILCASVLVSHRCYNTLPQNQWLQTSAICSFVALGAWKLQSVSVILNRGVRSLCSLWEFSGKNYLSSLFCFPPSRLQLLTVHSIYWLTAAWSTLYFCCLIFCVCVLSSSVSLF